MEFSAQQIADFLKGEVQGDPSVKVSNFSKIEEGVPGTLSFLSNPKYTHYIYESKASIILVNKTFQAEKEISATLIRVDDAYQSLAQLMTMVEQTKQQETGVSPLSYISESAIIGKNAFIAPFVYIGDNVVIGENVILNSHVSIQNDVTVGDNVQMYSSVTVYEKCTIGNNCILHAGAVIGSDGFGFAPTEDGSFKKIPQMGNVVLEDDVEVGANTTIDRATMGSTIIHKGVKIDNLVQVAHNVEVGENTVMAAQTGISGSTKIGKNCMFGGQVGLSGHIQVADKTILGAKTGLTNSVKVENLMYEGFPAIPAMNFRRSSIIYKNLPDLQKNIYEMEKRIKELENKISRISE